MAKYPSVDPRVPGAELACDMTPLGIILHQMRLQFGAKNFDAAVALARIAAPYIHPRATGKSSATNLADFTDAELESLFPLE